LQIAILGIVSPDRIIYSVIGPFRRHIFESTSWGQPISSIAFAEDIMSQTPNAVKIGPEFFKKIKQDYSDYKQAFLREAAQNAWDSRGCNNFYLTIKTNDQGKTVVTFENDGEPMTSEVLFDKFLALGGTTKTTDDTIGGMGVAKSLLCFMHDNYTIHTGNILIQGSGANFTVGEVEFKDGTKTTVVFDENHTDELIGDAQRLAMFSQWKGNFYLNYRLLDTNLKKGAFRRDLGWAKIYTNRSFGGILIVRTNGIPMFVKRTQLEKQCVIVELNNPCRDKLAANRDSLQYPYNYGLDELVVQLAVDKKSALKNDEPHYEIFNGKKHQANFLKSESTSAKMSINIDAVREAEQEITPEQILKNEPNNTFYQHSYINVNSDQQEFEYIIKNTTGMKIPVYLYPETFSDYIRKLMKTWTEALLAIHRLKECSIPFAVGALLDGDHYAEHEVYNGVHRYLINPLQLIESLNTRSFTKRFKLTAKDKWKIIAIAAHEYIHLHQTINELSTWHTDEYASLLTELLGDLLANREIFTRCFKN